MARPSSARPKAHLKALVLLLPQDAGDLPDVAEILLQGRTVAQKVIHIKHDAPVQRTMGFRYSRSESRTGRVGAI